MSSQPDTIPTYPTHYCQKHDQRYYTHCTRCHIEAELQRERPDEYKASAVQVARAQAAMQRVFDPVYEVPSPAELHDHKRQKYEQELTGWQAFSIFLVVLGLVCLTVWAVHTYVYRPIEIETDKKMARGIYGQ